MYLNFIYVFATQLNSEKSSLRFSEPLIGKCNEVSYHRANRFAQI